MKLRSAGKIWTWGSGGYRYDGVGNITAIGADDYSNDRLYRLTAAMITPHDGIDPVSRTYEYDPFGNMLKNGPHKHNVNGKPISTATGYPPPSAETIPLPGTTPPET